MLERTASRSQGKSVACERAADATRVDIVTIGIALDLDIDLGRNAIRTNRDAAG